MAEDGIEVANDSGNKRRVPRHAKDPSPLRGTRPEAVDEELRRGFTRRGTRGVWTGEEGGLRDSETSGNLSPVLTGLADTVVDRHALEEPYNKGEVAFRGDFVRMLGKTDFANSELLRYAIPWVERGRFERAAEITLGGVTKRLIALEFVPRDEMRANTRLDTFAGENRSVMILPDDFETHRPEVQVWELFERNMELALRRSGRTLYMKDDIYEMGLAYARTVRLGAGFERNSEEKDKILASAQGIEDWALGQLELTK